MDFSLFLNFRIRLLLSLMLLVVVVTVTTIYLTERNAQEDHQPLEHPDAGNAAPGQETRHILVDRDERDLLEDGGNGVERGA